MKKIVLFIILIILSKNIELQANDKFYSIIGGGGDPKEQAGKQFLHPFLNFIKNAPKTDTILFDGIHPQTFVELQMKSNKFKEIKKFNTANINTYLNKTLSDLESGRIKSQDQLLIYISSHGIPQNNNTNTHFISVDKESETSNESSSADIPLNLDVLKKIVTLAEKNNVKLAILDMSCFNQNSDR